VISASLEPPVADASTIAYCTKIPAINVDPDP
jgi:hypothetical protein